MRIDKFLSNAGAGSRSQVKTDLKKGLVLVNGQAVRSADFQVDPAADTIKFKGKELCLPGNRYYMLNKPMGCVSATEDPREQTVLDLFPAELRKDLFPVGRLDKDTEGLLLLTTDGALSHQLISPKKEIYKTYLVTCEKSVTKEDLLRRKQVSTSGKLHLPFLQKQKQPTMTMSSISPSVRADSIR